MSTTTTQRVELPAGYSVVDRLGAGGYGEVWKAIAPGGLEKAVKIVFGHCDEGMAERELKSLERVKSVRHPFLLSIERYEIVNNRLVIVTELADMSLSDCFQDHVNAGRSGIPREKLIAYLWDAADALDCLLEQHSLQHLDIKPENLLVVGDHIKVADFGLVKELAAKTLHSVMGGMTPLYSAPEIYDNNPSPRSDQYSLAIVYQHMLTATLPFSGRTPAQLAKQHTLAQPNVSPLSEADRAIVRRALEKSPQARFTSCREFVSALRSAGQPSSTRGAVPGGTSNSAVSLPTNSDDTKSISLSDTNHLGDPVCAAATQRLSEIEDAVDNLAKFDTPKKTTPVVLAEFPSVDGHIVDIETPAITSAHPVPTLFVGIGGIGTKVLKAIRARVIAHDPQDQLALAWLAIDTDRDSLKTSYDSDDSSDLSQDDKLLVQLRRPNQYRDDSQSLLQWVSRRWLYNIPRSLQTRGYRPLGRIAIVDHAAEVLTALQKRLRWLATQTESDDGAQLATRVVVIAGMSGGTGSGTVIDVAQAVRSLCLDDAQAVFIEGVLGCTYHHDSNDSLAAANMYALLTELNHAQFEGNSGENCPPGAASLYESSHRPFDEVYAVSISGRDGRSLSDLNLQSTADYLLLRSSGAISHIAETNDQGLLKTFNCVNLGQLANGFSARHQQELLTALVEYWLNQDPPTSDPDSRFFQTQANSHFAQAVLTHFPAVSDPAGDATLEDETNELKSRRSAKVKCVSNAFLQFLDTLDLQLDSASPNLDQAAIKTSAEQAIAALCQFCNSVKSTEKELLHKFFVIVNDELTQLAENSGGPDKTKLAQAALELFASGPLDCGYQRRTTLIEPQNQVDAVLARACRELCPTLASFSTTANETFLVREGSGLNPLHLGARLAEMYPDIADAAGRLHSRDDIGWRDLRAKIEPLAT